MYAQIAIATFSSNKSTVSSVDGKNLHSIYIKGRAQTVFLCIHSLVRFQNQFALSVSGLIDLHGNFCQQDNGVTLQRPLGLVLVGTGPSDRWQCHACTELWLILLLVWYALQEITGVINLLDPDGKGLISFDDFCRGVGQIVDIQQQGKITLYSCLLTVHTWWGFVAELRSDRLLVITCLVAVLHNIVEHVCHDDYSQLGPVCN